MWQPDPKRDLVLERVVDVRRELVWAAWTQPEHLKKWFTPAPWSVAECDIDLRPGGVFRVVMQSPEGEKFPSTGCYLEVVPNERLVWTDALLPGFRPSGNPFFTGILKLEVAGGRIVAGHHPAALAVGFHEDPQRPPPELHVRLGLGPRRQDHHGQVPHRQPLVERPGDAGEVGQGQLGIGLLGGHGRDRTADGRLARETISPRRGSAWPSAGTRSG